MKKAIVFLLMMVAGGFVGWAGARLLLGDRSPDAEPFLPAGYGLWLLLCLPVLYLLVVGIHELGHVALGRLQNFDFHGLAPAGSHGSFYLEQALFEAHYRNDLPSALAAFAQYTDGPFTEALSIHLAEAAIAALQEDKVTLAPLLPAIEAALPASVDQSRVPIIKNWLKHWEDVVATS